MALQVILHLRSTKPQRQARIDMFAKKDTEIFLHGMMQDEIESLLREIFQRADSEERGALGRLEFMDALLDADLGFTRREVNILMAAAESPSAGGNSSGDILYPDFIPVCFPVLRDVFIQGVVELPNDQDSLTQYLAEVFASGDSEATGLLTVADLTKLFRAADIGLTRLQIITVMSEAQEDKSGFVNYEKFAAHVAGMVVVLVSFDSQQTFASYLQKYRKTSEYYTILDMNQHTFEVRSASLVRLHLLQLCSYKLLPYNCSNRCRERLKPSTKTAEVSCPAKTSSPRFTTRSPKLVSGRCER